MNAALIRARDVMVGDFLVASDGTQPRKVTAVRPVMTTQQGRPRTRPAVQITIQSQHIVTHELYSDTVYLDSPVRVLTPGKRQAAPVVGDVRESD